MRSPVPDWCLAVRTVSLRLVSFSSTSCVVFVNDGGVCLDAVLFKSSSDSSVEVLIGAVAVVVVSRDGVLTWLASSGLIAGSSLLMELPAGFSGLGT